MTKAAWAVVGFGGSVALTLMVFGAFFRATEWAAGRGYGYGATASRGILEDWWMPLAVMVWGLVIALSVLVAAALLLPDGRTRSDRPASGRLE